MAAYELHWRGADGRTARAQVQAADAQAAARALGLAPSQLLAVQALPAPGARRAERGGPGAFGEVGDGGDVGVADAPGTGVMRPRGPRGAALPLRLLTQELAVLLQAGVPLLQSLQALREKEPRAAAAHSLAQLQQALTQGEPLSAAMAAQPQQFSPLLVALVQANERSGTLAPALADHARFLAWREALQARLLGALIYPALLLAASLAVLLLLLLVVLPRFAGVFDGMALDLPWASRQLFALSAQLQRPAGLALLAALLLLPAGLALALRRPHGRAAAQAALLRRAWRLPGLGRRLQELALATLYRALGLLLGSGVPVLPALRLVQALAAAPLRAGVAQAAEAVAAGQRLSDALDAAGLATPVASRMVRVGEASGALAPMLERAAAFHDEAIERLAAWVSQALNPMLMLLMGVLVGGVVLLMYLPIFALMEQSP